MILILEDSPDRIRGFRAAVASLSPRTELIVWSDAHAMMREVGEYLGAAKLISLDHDLHAAPGAPDPGDGLMAAEYLAKQPIIRPVIVHTSHVHRARCMMETLAAANWPTARVQPFNLDWIDRDWKPVARGFLEG